VRHWATHNEPWCSSVLGYETGEHAPGIRDPAKALRAAHHLLLSHGLAVPVIRANSSGAQVGMVLNLCPAYPASPSEADADAARKLDGSFNRWFLDPLFKGSYPQDAIRDRVRLGHLPEGPLPFVQPGDLAAISTPTDFLGINYYSRAIMRSDAIPESENAPRSIQEPRPEAVTDMGWEVYPDGLRSVLIRVHREYGPRKIFVTENGAAYPVGPDKTGRIDDAQRLEYVRRHLIACQSAIAAGVPLRGYFLWSFVDNFEWQFGYSKRFGVVWVDFETQQRTPKQSALWYRDVILSNAVDDGLDKAAIASAQRSA
jgi:beta-glucosidase